MTLRAAISCDVDTLASIYKGYGCRRLGGYSHTELRVGLENFSVFLESYGIKATLFMVGNDFCHEVNHDAIRAVVKSGHEIGNHTQTHAQGFRWLSLAEKEDEIAGMEEVCREVIGVRPTGFRSPGWNMGDDAISILKRHGYTYDSSVHPTCLMPILKFLHWRTHRHASPVGRTTMGQWNYMFAPIKPYRASGNCLGRIGHGGLVEFPVTVVPFVRVPFWATFTLATGFGLFKTSLRILKTLSLPIQYQFHLSDFVDYTHPELADQVPLPSHGVYVPKALRMPLEEKLTVFRRVIDSLVRDYDFVTLAKWFEDLAETE